jgi:hypothetical protein
MQVFPHDIDYTSAIGRPIDQIPSTFFGHVELQKAAVIYLLGEILPRDLAQLLASYCDFRLFLFNTRRSRRGDLMYDINFRGHGAFAILNSFDGTVQTGGLYYGGGSSSHIQHLLYDVKTIIPSEFAFAALKNDGTVQTWGSFDSGGDSDDVQSELHHIVKIVATNGAFAALRMDGEIITWGHYFHGGAIDESIRRKLTNVTQIFSQHNHFIAIANGKSVQWPLVYDWRRFGPATGVSPP